MPYSLRLSDLASMTPEEREARIARLAEKVREESDEPSRALDARIRSYELRYEMSSREMLERLRAGTMKETAEISRWLYFIQSRDCRVAG